MQRLQFNAARFYRTAVSCGLLAASCAFIGCQSIAPKGLGSLTAHQRDQKAIKQAKNDPFPSPSDVGLGERSKTF
ncbi:hypothetical protein [Lacipirellula sp.]|uniref:hypothetical protein n=1 Tax=Lacipirellula sp. TaxID=2691419 RepID=UPI003D0C5164